MSTSLKSFHAVTLLRVAIVAVLFSWFGALNATAQENPIVKIDSGAVQGITRDRVDEYLGIPYAAPPINELRWDSPRPIKPWVRTLDATKFGNTCAQTDGGAFASPSADENCLFLNVYVSHSANQRHDTLHPVLIWIHGGGYSGGASNDYDGTKLATQGGAVVVTINYRLGVLGFLAHPRLDREGHAFANYGLMDQQFAMQWVKRNIGAFGGDPGNVTIFGESSGGTSVQSHIVSPGAAGLFQHAISQSGAAIILKHPAYGAPRPLDVAEEVGSRFATAAGCRDQSTRCLRRLSVQKILEIQQSYTVNQAIIDGTVLPISYTKAFKTGHFNHVTLVNGSNHDEWRVAAAGIENATGKPVTAEDYPVMLEAYYGVPLAAKVASEYPLSGYLSPSLAYGAAVTDSLFACTGHQLNQWMANQTPTYAYEFADQTAPSYMQEMSFPLGAAHTYEIQYLFPLYHGSRGITHELNVLQEQLSAKMIGFWASASQAEEGKLWPKYDPRQDNYMRLILPGPVMSSGTFSADHKCAFWDTSGLYDL